ncbi:MAG: metallophosphoesterase [Acidobacteria bacterium]|nr:metallophosphoesterase [Acidobacteriota bacterium]MBI3657519.1 metallophosphoesterase [Acidobacteriota bacterium]
MNLLRKSLLRYATFFLFIFLIGNGVFALRIVRYPYLQNTTEDSLIIVWITDQNGDSLVEFGLTPELGQEANDPTSTTRHAVQLSGLATDTTYYYRVKTNGQILSEIESFKTANGADNPYFTMTIFGDSGEGTSAQHAVAAQIAAIQPNLILHTGDVIYPNGADFFYNARYFDIYRDTIKAVPVFPCLGNHDYLTSRGGPYLRNFYLPDNAVVPEHKGRYYSFNYGGAHFTVLDTELVPGGVGNADQRAWFEADLVAAQDALWKFVYFHRPPFSSGRHGSSISIRNVVAPLAEKYNVDYVFSGHDHTYERTTPILDSAPSSKGVLYLVTGGGGASLYDVGRSDWTAFSGKFYHTSKVTVENLILTLESVDSTGEIQDSFVWRKGVLVSSISNQTGEPRPDAQVRVLIGARQRAQRATDGDGIALFYVAEGEYALEASAPGCQTQIIEGVRIQAELLTEVPVSLSCP